MDTLYVVLSTNIREKFNVQWVITSNIFKKITFTTQKMKFCIRDFSSKCNQIRKKQRIRSYLL